MDINQWKEKSKAYFSSGQNITALLVAMVALVILLQALFQSPRPGVMDFGEYTQILYEVGLEQTEESLAKPEELQFVKVIEEYRVGDIPELSLLQVRAAQTLVYPVSLINIICKVIGCNFHTAYLAFLLMIVTVLCFYFLTKSLYCFFKNFTPAIGFFMNLILLCGYNTVYFNSLYANGIFVVSLLLFLTVILHIITEHKKGFKPFVLVAIAGLFVLNATPKGIFFLPVITVIMIWMMFHCGANMERKAGYFTLAIVVIAFVLNANVRYSLNNDSAFSRTQLYHSIFTGILPNAQDPEAILTELGLPVELVEDMNKNAYLEESDYVIAPYSQEAEETIFSRVIYGDVLQVYGNHPDIYWKMLQETVAHSQEISTTRFLYTNRLATEGTEWVERFVWWQWIRQVIVPGTMAGYLVFFALNLAMAVLLIVIKKQNYRPLGYIYLGVLTLCLCELLSACAFTGFAEVDNEIYPFIILSDLLYVFLFSGIAFGAWKLVNFLRIRTPEAIEEEAAYQSNVMASEPVNEPSPLTVYGKEGWQYGKEWFVEHVLKKPFWAAALLTVITAFILINVLFCPRIGAYNNGDFGRMMSAMNLQYTAEDWANPDELSLTKVVEVYDWVDNYDYTKIMFYNADLTQSWMSLAVKLIDNYVGTQFSTVYVTIIYTMLLIASFFVIMWVLFKRFGWKWVWMGVIFMILLFDQVNLGWLNSLFGEGPAYVGLLMVIASSLYVVDKERGTCTWGFLPLLFSINFFMGSKAQFTTTAPVLLLWTLILAIYHFPKKKWKALLLYPVVAGMIVAVGITAITIYKGNEDISSPDATYQAVFYGILMISDDPEADLIELGLDPAMAVDAGKHAFLDKSEYYVAPRTEEAEEMLYSKVNTFDILFFYLRHPDKLWKIMQVTTEAAAANMPDFILYVGEKTTEDHHIMNKFRLWSDLREYFHLNYFWQLIVMYAAVLGFSLSILFRKKYEKKDKLLILLYLVIAGVGIIQFPLTIIGNGFADNTKQLYIFRLTQDITMVMGIYLLIPWIKGMLTKLVNLIRRKSDKEEGGQINDSEEKLVL